MAYGGGIPICGYLSLWVFVGICDVSHMRADGIKKETKTKNYVSSRRSRSRATLDS